MQPFDLNRKKATAAIRVSNLGFRRKPWVFQPIVDQIGVHRISTRNLATDTPGTVVPAQIERFSSSSQNRSFQPFFPAINRIKMPIITLIQTESKQADQTVTRDEMIDQVVSAPGDHESIHRRDHALE